MDSRELDRILARHQAELSRENDLQFQAAFAKEVTPVIRRDKMAKYCPKCQQCMISRYHKPTGYFRWECQCGEFINIEKPPPSTRLKGSLGKLFN